jgi:(2Fe-2S) ferredoxin
MVIYPEGVWYQYKSESDIDKIIDDHLINNKLAEELVLHNKKY